MNAKLALAHADSCSCCCCQILLQRRFLLRFRIIFLDDEQAALLDAARAWQQETGRRCADFFRTLREGPTADRFLAGRPTLLLKVRTLNDIEALFTSNTICARLPIPAPPPPRGPFTVEFSGTFGAFKLTKAQTLDEARAEVERLKRTTVPGRFRATIRIKSRFREIQRITIPSA